MDQLNPPLPGPWSVIWTEPAFQDLEEIVDYIRRDSPRYAENVASSIYHQSETLSSFPLRGRVIPEMNRPDLREIFSYSYRIMYQVREDKVIILSIVHFSRDFLSQKKTRED